MLEQHRSVPGGPFPSARVSISRPLTGSLTSMQWSCFSSQHDSQALRYAVSPGPCICHSCPICLLMTCNLRPAYALCAAL